jgi:hypothetical protein
VPAGSYFPGLLFGIAIVGVTRQLLAAPTSLYQLAFVATSSLSFIAAQFACGLLIATGTMCFIVSSIIGVVPIAILFALRVNPVHRRTYLLTLLSIVVLCGLAISLFNFGLLNLLHMFGLWQGCVATVFAVFARLDQELH